MSESIPLQVPKINEDDLFKKEKISLDDFDKELLLSDQLDIREKKFLYHYLRTGNKSIAIKEAGYSINYNPLNKTKLKAALHYLMDKKGLTDGKLLDVAIEGLNAEKQHFSKDGELVGTSPDHLARHAFFKDLTEIKEWGQKEKEQVVAAVNINISTADASVLVDISEKLEKLNKNLELNGDENIIDVPAAQPATAE